MAIAGRHIRTGKRRWSRLAASIYPAALVLSLSLFLIPNSLNRQTNQFIPLLEHCAELYNTDDKLAMPALRPVLDIHISSLPLTDLRLVSSVSGNMKGN